MQHARGKPNHHIVQCYYAPWIYCGFFSSIQCFTGREFATGNLQAILVNYRLNAYFFNFFRQVLLKCMDYIFRQLKSNAHFIASQKHRIIFLFVAYLQEHPKVLFFAVRHVWQNQEFWLFFSNHFS